ncbi:hypothetical protein JOE48_001780 [Methylobacterium sp. PvR107]|nr:hypothetical protein [Methylobacterium sp. PvR107]
MAIWLITNHPKGIASTTLAKDLKIAQKSAWLVLHRLRHAARTKSFNAPLKGTVEADETYVGGKEENKTATDRKGGTPCFRIPGSSKRTAGRAGPYASQTMRKRPRRRKRKWIRTTQNSALPNKRSVAPKSGKKIWTTNYRRPRLHGLPLRLLRSVGHHPHAETMV